ncbi:MAG: 6-carboxytetrahydropterin synthase [Bacteroidetes bacterium]|nr:6-carboxytetrahydropterin synthase [Bacteroidota bacterium]
MVYVTRIEHFNSAHRVFNPEWDNQKNFEVFGKCSNENWHGHNYVLEITVKGESDPVTGFVMNAKKISTIVLEKVVDKVDHKNLNLDVDFMKGVQPSTENFVKAIWSELKPHISQLHSLKLQETPKIYAEYYGE